MQSSSISIDFALLSLSDSSTTPSVSYSRTNQNFLKFYSELQSIKQSFESKRNSLPDEHQIYDFSVSQYQIELPSKTTIFPRHKKIPTGGSELTKWERFAQQKGINKKKRSRMVFDEIKQDWVPRWGARSIKQNRENENFAVEEKPGDMGDPFRKKGLEKELRNEKTKLRQNKNELLRKGNF